MSVRAYYTANLTYTLITDALVADAWYTQFRLNNAGAWRNTPQNDQAWSAIVPPDAEGSTGRFVCEAHWEVPSQVEVDALVDELEQAIIGTPQTPGTYCTAVGAENGGGAE